MGEKCPFLSLSGPYSPAFGLNTEIYRVNLLIKSEYGKIRAKKPPNKDTFYVVSVDLKVYSFCFEL